VRDFVPIPGRFVHSSNPAPGGLRRLKVQTCGAGESMQCANALARMGLRHALVPDGHPVVVCPSESYDGAVFCNLVCSYPGQDQAGSSVICSCRHGDLGLNPDNLTADANRACFPASVTSQAVERQRLGRRLLRHSARKDRAGRLDCDPFGCRAGCVSI